MKQYRLKGDHAVKCMAESFGDRERSRPWYDVHYPCNNFHSSVFQVPAEFFEAAWELDTDVVKLPDGVGPEDVEP